MFSPLEYKHYELVKMAGVAVDDTAYQRPLTKTRRGSYFNFDMLMSFSDTVAIFLFNDKPGGLPQAKPST